MDNIRAIFLWCKAIASINCFSQHGRKFKLLITSRFPSLSGLFHFLVDLLPHKKDGTPDQDFSQSDMAGFFRSKPCATEGGVDEQTWHDLDMETYLNCISENTSIFGRQVLCDRLRRYSSKDAVSLVACSVEKLIEEKKTLAALQLLCRPLLQAETEVGSLFGTRPCSSKPKWVNCLWFFQLLLCISFIGIWISPYSIIVSIFLIILSGSLQISHHSMVTAWSGKARSLQLMLSVASKITVFFEKNEHVPKLALAPSDFNPVKLSGKLACSSMAAVMPGVGEYLDWFFADNIAKFYSSTDAFENHASELEQCFLLVSSLEADITVARHLEKQGIYSRAIVTEDATIQFDHVVHPMLHDAIPVSFSSRKRSVFLSGKNGVGKSTFLRTIGVNLLVGRSFGFCYARSAKISLLPLYSSIRNEDSLSTGESLYTSELVRAKELLHACTSSQGVIVLIDEIFRGTNHIESISVAAAVLYEMSRNSMVIVSSHNLVLAPLLAEWFTPLCLERDQHGRAVHANEGLLIETNGIQLLAAYGFDASIQERAGRLSGWLNSYLAKPDGYPELG